MTPLTIVEPLVTLAAFFAAEEWIRRFVERATNRKRPHARLMTLTLALTFIVAGILDYVVLFWIGSIAPSQILTLTALILQIAGTALLAKSVVFLSVPLSMESRPREATARTKERPIMLDRLTSPQIRRVDPRKAGVAAGIVVTALSNDSRETGTTMLLLLLLLPVVALLRSSAGARRRRITNPTVSCVLGALFLALGTFRLSCSLNIEWSHPASVLWGLVAGYLALARWLVESCSQGRVRKPEQELSSNQALRLSDDRSTFSPEHGMLVPALTAGWVCAVGAAMHFGWPARLGMNPWQMGLLLYLGLGLILCCTVLFDPRLPPSS